jgi:tetratricopeptide (TPR) repeat protein
MPASASRNRWLIGLSLAVLMAGAGFGAWWWLRPNGQPAADMVAAMSANNRGVGLMEMFDYEEAVKAFDEVGKVAPEWLPGKINLGIALLNTRKPENMQRAIDLYQNIVKQDPDNPYAHFCLGVIFDYQSKIDEARVHFERVTRIDPKDAHAWYSLGYTTLDNPALQQECFEKALTYDPYLRRALNGLQILVRADDPRRADELLKTFEGLNKIADFEKQRYGEMGRYATVIGHYPPGKQQFGPIPLFARSDKFHVNLKPGTRWARAEDFGAGVSADLRRAVRKRFGATMVVLDFNRDGKPDLFLLGAVVEGGKVRDLLLRNEGNDLFTDVTHEAGLADPRLSLGCTVGDFDNDGYPDLFITGIGRQWLFRNKGKSTGPGFEDVTAQAGLDKLDGVCLGSCFVDLDQDGDLDLVVARYAATTEEALELLTKGTQGKVTGGFAIYVNVGEAKPHSPSEDPPPLTPAFKHLPVAALQDSGPAVAVAATDLDRDGDLDLVLLADHRPGVALVNDRLLRFRQASLPKGLVPPRLWNGALVLDAHHEGRSDLLMLSPDQPPLFLTAKAFAPDEQDSNKWFDQGACNSPPLVQAQAIDIDYDGWTDIVGLSDQRVPVLLQNQGGKLAHVPEGLGSDKAWPKDLVAIAAARFSSDPYAHVIVWSESSGLHLHRNGGNGNEALLLDLTGHRKAEMSGSTVRCNADAFGTRVTAQTGNFSTGAELTTLSAGLGQSRQPLLLGMGKRSQAEVVRLRWPDNCWQAELNLRTASVIPLSETNRKPDSCPCLFTWDGHRFTFVTDFLGGAALGEALPQGDGACRQPRPEESVKIEAHQLVPKDGFYVLKVAEPMNEITYLDHLQLVVVDHPAGVRVYPDERLGGPPATQELFAFRTGTEIFPVKALDHRGRDVTGKLRRWDRDTVSDFARRTWVGIAEEHWIELDFGDRLAHFGDKEPLVLFLAGWADYPFPDSEWAAHQAGVDLKPPMLERRGADGEWQTVLEDAGFPAGLPRMMTLDLTGKLTGPRCVLRLRTNMTVFWDQVFVAPVTKQKDQTFRVTPLEVASASLAVRGCVQEYSPDGREPTLYDYHRLDNVAVTRQAGRLTRVGDVTELLRDRDDRMVVFGPGDEVTVQFDARTSAPLPQGWTRSFVLRTCGYVKACGPLVVTGDTVGPLPFHKMSRFPFAPGETYPQTPELRDCQQRYNTRQVGGRTK